MDITRILDVFVGLLPKLINFLSSIQITEGVNLFSFIVASAVLSLLIYQLVIVARRN